MTKKEIIDVYCREMLTFFKNHQGNLFDFLVSLGSDSLLEMQSDDNSEIMGALGILAYSYVNADENRRVELPEELCIEIIQSIGGLIVLAYLQSTGAIQVDYDCDIFDLDCEVEWEEGKNFTNVCKELGVT